MDRLHRERKLDKKEEADRWGNIDERLKGGEMKCGRKKTGMEALGGRK